MVKKRRKKRKLSQSVKNIIQAVGLIILSFVCVALVGKFQEVTQPTRTVGEEFTQEEFIQVLAPVTQDVYAEYGVLPSISLAQAILESNWGKSQLAADYYNLYGVKADSFQPHVDLSTQEFIDGQWITITGRFRAYNSWRESVEAHAKLLKYGVSWNHDLYKGVIEASSYEEAARALQDSGYATDPTYAEKLIYMIRVYHLDEYDQINH